MTVNNGDIFQIGNHTIGCGSSIDLSFVDKVIGDKKIRAVITDPPYGVDYGANTKSQVKKIIGDELQTDEVYILFTKNWLKPILSHLNDYNTFHIFNADTKFLALQQGMLATGIYFSQMLVWIKNQPVMGRKDYLSQFEVIAYGWYGKHKLERSKGKSVLYYPKPKKSKLHPTQKPVGLMRKIIPNVTSIGDYVYDAFLGSGTTAVACEHLGRGCIGIELDPEYVEIILLRLEKLTGKVREKIN